MAQIISETLSIAKLVGKLELSALTRLYLQTSVVEADLAF